MRGCSFHALAVSILFALTAGSHAREISATFTFTPSQVRFTPQGDYERITLEGGNLVGGEAGMPWLPASHVNVLLPAGAEVRSVSVSADETLLRSDVRIHPLQPRRPRSKPRAAFVEPDADAYSMTGMFPASLAQLAGTHKMRGRTFASIRLNPVRCIPASGDVFLAGKIIVTLTVAEPATKPVAAARNNDLFRETVASLVVNPDARDSEPITAPAPRGEVDYLIITRAALSNAFVSLANHRASRDGLTTRVMTVDTITNMYSGADIQAKIRNCISNHVASFGTLYVVLGGDDTVVPTRSCYVVAEGEVESAMPTDLYYSCLDGDWDADGDSRYGETTDNVDLAWDVIVGRIPIRTAAQAAAYIDKLTAFESNPPLSLMRRILLGGMEAWDTYSNNNRPTDDVTGDGHLDFRDSAHTSVSDSEMWDRRLYRDGIRPYWQPETVAVFCDTLTSWDTSTGGSYAQNASNMRSKLNLGWYHLFFSGHGSETSWGLETGSFDNSDATALTNKTVVVYTDACLTGHFDGSAYEPCLGESFLRNANGGALVFIGCSRYGWGEPDSPPASNTSDGGPSTVYGYKFYNRLHQTNGVSIGRAFAMHKADMAGVSGTDDCERWIQFGLNLLGDPAIVYDGPTNLPPSLAVAPSGLNKIVTVSNELRFVVSATEPNGDDVSLSAADLPARAVFSPNPIVGVSPVTNLFTWIPDTPGTSIVTFAAADKDGTNSMAVQITVRPAPVPGSSLDIGGWQVIQYNGSITFTMPADTEVPAGGYLVIGRNATQSAFESFWGVTFDSNVVYVDGGDKMPQLNGAEQYELLDATATRLEGPTPSAINPLNQSVKRNSPTDDATLVGSWTATTLSTANPGSGGTVTGSGNLVINEYSDASNYIYEFVELFYDSIAGPVLPAASVSITNPVSCTVPNATTNIALQGTCNTNTVGHLRWTNSLTGANDIIPAAPSWQIDGIALSVGANVLTVRGTNSAGAAATASVTIARESSGGSPGGFEDFANFSAAGSYIDGTFAGRDGSTWTFAKCRGDSAIQITNQTPCMGRNQTPPAYVKSGTISGGCGTLSFNYRKPFTTELNFDVLVNDTVVTTITGGGTDTNAHHFSGELTVNIPGDFILVFTQRVGGGQASIDNIRWTSFGSGSGDNTPAIAITTPAEDSVSVPYSVAVIDLAGTCSTSVIGQLLWTNGLTGGSGSVSAGTSWSIAGISLVVGENIITVSATNNAAELAADTVSVVRLEEQAEPETLRFQGFEGAATDTWTYTSEPGSGAIAVTAETQHGGSESLKLTGSSDGNSDPYVLFDNVNVTGYRDLTLSIAFSASGPDSDDDLYLDISYDDGTTWNGVGTVKLVDGYANANIAFGATSSYNPTTVPGNPWSFNLPDGSTQIRVRVRFDEKAGAPNDSDHYYIDDIRLVGVEDAGDDADGDGLPDGWEMLHFGTLDYGPGDDPDGDGVNNLAEFVADTFPAGAGGSSSLLEVESMTADGYFTISFNSTNSRVYSLMYSDDLLTGEWELLESAVPGVNGNLSLHDTNNVARRAYRLRVNLP